MFWAFVVSSVCVIIDCVRMMYDIILCSFCDGACVEGFSSGVHLLVSCCGLGVGWRRFRACVGGQLFNDIFDAGIELSCYGVFEV